MKLAILCLVFVVYGDTASLDCQTAESYDVANPPPVNIRIYYESMCPFCRKFIVTQLYPTFQKLPDSVINVTMVPYGFAHEKEKDGEYTMFNCQHGPQECEGNVIAACVLNMTQNDPRAYMPFIYCMETETAHTHQLQALSKCASQAKLSRTDILECYGSKEGSLLHQNMHLVTSAAHIHYVPWIVVNGNHTDVIQHDAYGHLLEVVCQEYTGPEPDACKQRTKATLLG